MFNTNSTRMAILAVIIFYLSACAPTAPTELPPAKPEPSGLNTDAAQPLLKTAQGDFVIASARLVDEANGVEAATGEKILLVILTQPDLTNLNPNNFSLEAFSNLTHDPKTEIYILGDDGSRTISTMGGWVGEEFAMGFKVPVAVETYTLYWTGNPPIALSIEK